MKRRQNVAVVAGGDWEQRSSGTRCGGWRPDASPWASRRWSRVAPFSVALVMPDGPASRLAIGHERRYASDLGRISKPVGIMDIVGQQPLCRWLADQQAGRPGPVADLARNVDEAGRATLRVADDRRLGVRTGRYAAERTPPFVTARFSPWSGRCAFCLQIGHVDCHRIQKGSPGGQPVDHPGNDPLVDPPFEGRWKGDWPRGTALIALFPPGALIKMILPTSAVIDTRHGSWEKRRCSRAICASASRT